MEAEMLSGVLTGSSRTSSIVRVLAGFAVIAVIAVVVTACGDVSTEALSKEEYVEQANAICAATDEEIEPIVDEFFEEAFADGSGDVPVDGVPQIVLAFDDLFDDVLTPAVEEQMAELRALEPPEEDAEMLDALYDDLEAGLDFVNATLDDAVAGDKAAIEAFSSGASEEQVNDANQRAREYGLTVCGAEN
jgi:hypothetical protein